ncbi:hypothetical protein D9M68_881950 [compost metagenome]
MPAGWFSRAGTTTITLACGGMPSASSRRGRCTGFTDSPIRRLSTATTASDAGSSITSPTSTLPSWAGQPASSQSGRCSSQATSSSVPTSMAPR